MPLLSLRMDPLILITVLSDPLCVCYEPDSLWTYERKKKKLYYIRFGVWAR